MSRFDDEVRTRSVPAAGHLICVGFEPLRVTARPDGSRTFVFSPAAREPMDQFFRAKARLDAMLDAINDEKPGA
jgi:hypothetical protein